MSRLEFYKKVRIKQDASDPGYAGRFGVVGGISEGSDGVTYYAVKLEDDDVVMFAEDQLEALGDKVTREEMFPGGSVKVAVDDEGRAEVIEDDPPR